MWFSGIRFGFSLLRLATDTNCTSWRRLYAYLQPFFVEGGALRLARAALRQCVAAVPSSGYPERQLWVWVLSFPPWVEAFYGVLGGARFFVVAGDSFEYLSDHMDPEPEPALLGEHLCKQ